MRFTAAIPGKPVPQGSKRHVGNGILIDTNAKAIQSWRDIAVGVIERATPLDWKERLGSPMEVDIAFYFQRPKSHYGSQKNQDAGKIRPSAPRQMAIRPDIDKLVRAVLDVCTIAGVWRDDSQVVGMKVHKFYARNRPGTRITFDSDPLGVETSEWMG